MSANWTCQWDQDVEGNWYTSCGNIFVITEGTPSENDMAFCCYCGGKLDEHCFSQSELEEAE